MKYLLLLRHGKAEPYSFEKSDFNRNLTDRGQRNSQQISQILLRLKILPQVIITSPANRTVQTAQIFAVNIGFDTSKIVTIDELYDHVGVGQVLSIMEGTKESAEVLMLVGHNPWISSVASEFTNGFYQSLPTTGLVGIAFDVDKWTDIEARSGKLEFFEYPKKYD